MRHYLSPITCLMTLLAFPSLALAAASPGPWDGGKFKGRLAHSADGNANDEDDWAAFPVAFAIIEAFGQMDRVVHVDYNNILRNNDARFYRNMTDSVLGSAQRFGIRPEVMFDCQKDLEGALESIRKAIDASSAENPLYYILAGPMEVPLLGIQRSNPEKRKHVYCISHSVWNDGFSQPEKLHLHKYTKRDLIATGVNWVQVKPGNGLADSTRTSSTPAQWAKWEWMRDSADKRLGWIFSRLQVEERCDVSDATMTWFLLTGDEDGNVGKLKALLEDKKRPSLIGVRREIRIEAENFHRVENFRPDRTAGRTVSHQVSLVLNGSTGRIATVLDQPYAPRAGVFDVDVRYVPAKAGRSEFRLMVGGAPRGEPWTASDNTSGWQSRTIKGVEIKAGDEIQVVVQGGGAEPPRLDYVQFNVAGAATNARSAGATKKAAGSTKDATKSSSRSGASNAARSPQARFTATGPLDDPAALPGQIIVAGGRPGYLKYNGGGPAFLCGPDNPELFLFLGELNKDGTRSKGEQQRIIDRVVASGANAFHVILWRMNRSNMKNEGDDKHCPFVDHDPAKPLNEAVLAQWEGWMAQFEAAGVVVHVDFYDDATDVEKIGWTLDKDGNLHPDERRFIEGIVNRWKRFKNIVWSVGESVNKLPRTRIPHIMKTTELIAKTDNHHHPILLSFVAPDTGEKDIGKDFVYPGDFYSDPNVHLVTWLHVLPHGDDYEAQHEAYLRWSRVGYGRFIMMKNETEKFPRTQPQSRIYQWSSVMTGQHSMEAGHDVLRRGNLLDADGHVARFMEQTDWHTMRPSDSRAAQSTKWVLAGPDSYIAYTYAYDGAMGLKELRAGNYRLVWLDTVTGKTVTVEQAAVAGGEAAWQKPPELGTELALYVKRQPAPRSVPVGPNPESVTRGFDGRLYVTVMGERREKGDRDGRIVAVEANGRVTMLADGFDDPKGIVFTGEVLITADFDHVWAIDKSGGKRLIAGPEKFPTPPLYLNDVVLEPGGKSVLVTDMGARTKMMAGPGQLWPLGSEQARGIPALGRVYRVTLDGQVTVVVDHDARMPIPNGVDRFSDGTLYIGEFFLGTILEWRNGTWRQIGDDYRSIDGLAHDTSGNLYATEVFTGRVWRVSVESGRRTLLATLQSAADLIVDEKTNSLIVPDSKAGAIVFVPLPR